MDTGTSSAPLGKQTEGFRVVVAAAGPLVAPANIELLKAALLYGDFIVVLSPMTSMLLSAPDFARFDGEKQVRLLRGLVILR